MKPETRPTHEAASGDALARRIAGGLPRPDGSCTLVHGAVPHCG